MGWLVLGLIVMSIIVYAFSRKKNKADVVVYTPEYSTPPASSTPPIHTTSYTASNDLNAPLPSFSYAKHDPTPALQLDMEDRDPDRDAWEGAFWDAANPFPVKATLKLTYVDGKGDRSQRIVDVREFDEYLYEGMLIGHCQLRDATRTFRFDRIQECINMETGEVVQDVAGFLKKKYEASPEATLDKLYGDHHDLLRVLLYISKADGRLTSKERLSILEHIKSISNDERLDDSMVKKLFQAIEIPSPLAFKQCCGRVAKRVGYDRDLLLVTVDRMVASEKTVNPAEKEAVDYLRKRLSE